jgi:hypothetical protein
MTEPLATRADLDEGRCDDPGCEECGPFWFHPRCHPEAPTWASYHQGELRLVCAECDATVIAIAVAG